MRVAVPLFAVLIAACAAAPQTAPPVPASAAPLARSSGNGLPTLPTPAPVPASEYAARRAALLDSIGDGVLVVFGAPSPAFDYLPFSQLADFRYLTGIMEPSAAYIAVKNGARVQEQLFVLDRDPAREVWEGARLGPDGATSRTGIPAQSARRFEAVLDSLAKKTRVLYSTISPPVDVSLTADLTAAQQIIMRLREKHPALELKTIQGLIRNQRAAKTPAELDRIRRAVHISALAHREAMRTTAPGMNEFEIRALMEYVFRRYGAEGPAYGSIVGSGPNSTTLHYQASDRFMDAGDMLLIDAAASYGGYAADVTRTFPVNGTFSPTQRAIYDIVLAAQKAAAAQMKPGATWTQLSDATNREIRSGLARLGLIDSPDATFEVRGGVRPQAGLYYMHGLGHGVGLAVHDPDVSQTRGRFAPGSVVTIEPGVYVRRDALDHLADTPANRAMIQRLRPALERYVDIGVRIEDVFIIGEDGQLERASAAAPREIAEIEALMREPGLGEAGRRGDIVEWFRANRGR